MSKTGRAIGTLSPIIYFQRSDGYIILPVYEAGDPSLAHKFWQMKYKNHPSEKWEWREAGTMSEVDKLQTRLIDQETRRNNVMLANHDRMRTIVRQQVGDSLRQRMVSSSTSPYEREFIQHYLQLREGEKRDKYRQTLEHQHSYLWAREMDSGTKVEDRMVIQPGEFWRNEAQQKG